MNNPIGAWIMAGVPLAALVLLVWNFLRDMKRQDARRARREEVRRQLRQHVALQEWVHDWRGNPADAAVEGG